MNQKKFRKLSPETALSILRNAFYDLIKLDGRTDFEQHLLDIISDEKEVEKGPDCCEQRREEFYKFVSKGESTPDFNEHIEVCDACRTASDWIFDRQCKVLREIGQMIQM
jgi:hypothetical protein